MLGVCSTWHIFRNCSSTCPSTRVKVSVLTLLAMLCLSSSAAGQHSGKIAFERFSIEHGLSNYTVTSILQDRRGFLWLGTQAGLNRYDGYSFKQYLAANSGLTDDYVNVLYEDYSGMIWVGTQQAGLFAFDPKTERFTAYAHNPEEPSSLSHNDVLAIYEDQNRNLWIGTRGGGLNRFNRATESFLHVNSASGGRDGGADRIVRAIGEDPSRPDVLWIGTEGGLKELDTGAEAMNPHYDLPAEGNRIDDAIRTIYADLGGILWIGTQNEGLYAIHSGSNHVEHYVHEPENGNSLASNYVLTIHGDSSGSLWIGTYDRGLTLFDRANDLFTRYENAPADAGSIPHNQVQAIHIDRSGVLWVGTWAGLGKRVLARPRFVHYMHLPDDPNSLSHPGIASIFEDQFGFLWIGTLGGGLNRLDRRSDRVTRYNLPFEDVVAICQDRNGTLWLGTRDNQLHAFEPATREVSSYPLGTPADAHADDIVVTIYESPTRPGLLWIGTKLNGVYTFDSNARRVVQHYGHDIADESSLSDNYAWPIYEDRTGTIWVGTWGGGLNRFDENTRTFKRYRNDDQDPHSISGNRVVSIHEDGEGRLWVGTFGRGLTLFDRLTERFTHYTEQDGLPSNDIVGILLDNKGFLWLSTNNGISRFDPRTTTAINFGVANGLQGGIFRIGAAHKNKQGEIFFGGENGLNVIHPSRALAHRQAPPVILTDFHLLGQSAQLDSSISTVAEIKLDHDENYIAFEFAVLDFIEPSNNQYAFMLEGVDREWIEVRNQRFVRYPKLAPGEYTFRVKGANSSNQWNDQGASVRLFISPPWWKAPWAYALYVAALMLIVSSVYRWRVRHLKNQAIELKRMVDIRTEDLQAEKEKTEKQAEKLIELEQVKDRFFANISHEFRTPLTLIVGPIQDALAGEYGSVPSRLRSQLSMMHRSGERLHRLINQLLDLSKLEVGRMELRARRRDLVSFVKGIVLSFSHLADRHRVTLQCHAGTEHLLVYFDADKLEKVISNLLSNAIKFTPGQGKVLVTIHEIDDDFRPTPLGDGTDDLTPYVAHDWAEIRVSDTGTGIPAEEVAHVFDRFHQVDTSTTRRHEGTGIGLALTKELVTLHGGSIHVESEEGFGTTFIVRLPRGKDHFDPKDLLESETDIDSLPFEERAQSEDSEVAELAFDYDANTPESSADRSPPQESAPTILIIDDNADVRAYLRSHLAPLYHVFEAADGVEGLARAREITPDLVISDVMMPKMDGVALCRALKQDEQLNHIPVILLTAKATDDSKIEGLTIGADDYIYKPFNAQVLLARVENLVEVRRTLRERFSGEVRIGPSEISVSSTEAMFVEKVRGIVERHMVDSNFDVDWFADEVGMSRRHLHRKLRETAGLSPAGYIRMMRLERAAQLLEQRAGSVSEIAYDVGFKNPDHFSRLFQQVFGVSPSRYPSEKD